LTIPEWRVLAVVSQAPAMAARDVVALTPMDKMAVSRAVSSLETKQLIARSPGEDRRVSELRLSERGHQVFERIARIAQEYEARALSGLSADERTALFDALAKIEKTLNANNRGKTA
jgi:DNA-binding MarR family transcriptional regulator